MVGICRIRRIISIRLSAACWIWSTGFDPLEKAKMAAKTVCRGDHRKYYRFRPAKFYGGIATADCLGCCLRCKFCWSWPKVINPGRYGRLYSPGQVSAKLTNIALKKGFHHIRISGNEPTIARARPLRWRGGATWKSKFICDARDVHHYLSFDIGQPKK